MVSFGRLLKAELPLRPSTFCSEQCTHCPMHAVAGVYNVMPSTLKMPKADLKVHSPLSTHADKFLDRFSLRAKCDGHARPMVIMAGVGLALPAHLLDQP